MLVTFFIIGSIFGVIAGVFLERYRLSNKHYVGVLRVDTSDPDDGPYLFLEISKDPHNLEHNSYVKMRVNTTSYISQD